MNYTSQLQTVPLSAIDFKDRTYCLTLEEDPPSENLLTSIKRFGILHPPILRHKKNSSYCIVAGRKRITAAQHLAPDSPVTCRVVPKDIEETSIFSLLLEEAATGKPLSITAQIIFFEKLLLISPPEQAIPMLEQLGYKPQTHILKDLLKLRTLSEPVLQAMHQGEINIKNARKLLNLSATDQEVIIQLLTDLHFGGSKQQKLIDLSTELIMRKNLPLKKILADFPAVSEQGQPMNIPQHGAALLSWLQSECFPQSVQAENNFKRQVAGLNLPSTMQITHTPSFEDEEILLTLRLHDWRSLIKVFEKIKKLMQDE